MASEQQIRIAAQLYETRDTMRRLMGDEYQESVRPWKDSIRQVMASLKIDNPTQATLRIMEVYKRGKRGRKDIPPLLLAACVELIEPSEVPRA